MTLDRPNSTMVKSLPEDTRIHWNVIDQNSCNQCLPSDNLNLSIKQVTAFFWAAEMAKNQGFDYFAFIDSDELVCLKRSFKDIIAEFSKDVTALRLNVCEMWRAGSDSLEEPFASSLAISKLSDENVDWKSLFGWKSQFMHNGFMGHSAGKSIYILPLVSGEIGVHRPLKGAIAAGVVHIADSDGCLLHFDSGSFDTWKFKWDSHSNKNAIARMSPTEICNFSILNKSSEIQLKNKRLFLRISLFLQTPKLQN